MSFSMHCSLYRFKDGTATFIEDNDVCDGGHAGAHFGFITSMPEGICEVNPAIQRLADSEFEKAIPTDALDYDARQRYFKVDDALDYYRGNKGLIPHKGYLSDLAKSVLIEETSDAFLSFSDYSNHETEHTPNSLEWEEDFKFILDTLEELRLKHGENLVMLVVGW